MRPMNIMQNLKEGENETKKCVICGKTYKGWGNDAWPVADGYCCDKCNNEKVLPARIAQMYGLKKESNLTEDNDNNKDYTVTIGFLGGYGSGDCDGTKDYEVYASSRADAVAQVLDNPGAEAPQDLEVSSIEKVDGDWEVVVAFAAGDYNPGYHTYTEDGSFSEEDAKSSALDEAQCDGDLYVEAVDGTPFDYEMGESAGMVNEEGTVDEKSSKSNISHFYVIGENDFQELLKINGGAFADGYLEISVQEANELANKQGLNASNMGINSNE